MAKKTTIGNIAAALLGQRPRPLGPAPGRVRKQLPLTSGREDDFR